MIDKKKLAGVLLAGVLTVMGATSAFAEDQTTSNQLPPLRNEIYRLDHSKISSTVKSTVDSLVAAGTITREQADAIVKAYEPGERKGFVRMGRSVLFDRLIAEGKLTQEQADAINSAIKSGVESKKSIEDVLGDLVTKGTITETQKESVLNCLPVRKMVEKPFLIQDGENAAERPLIILQDQLDGLVEKGTITKEQADAIRDIAKPLPNGAGMGMRANKIFNPLAELVSSGTITQAQADAVNTAIKAALGSPDKN